MVADFGDNLSRYFGDVDSRRFIRSPVWTGLNAEETIQALEYENELYVLQSTSKPIAT